MCSLTGEGCFVSPEPLEYRAVEVGEPLETQGQQPRRIDWRWRPGRADVLACCLLSFH
jgi:hypothetical protein